MNFKFAAFSLSAAVLSASLAFADKTPMSGTIISMQSVECGSKKKGKTSTSLLCHQYVVRTTTAEYQLRQQKPAEEHVFPANTPIEFTVDKNKAKFKVDGKKYEYLVVGTSALPGH
jgi:hypothetical protein